MEQWEEIDGFASPGEFRRFMTWIEAGIADGALKEVPVQSRYSGAANFEERWFQAPQGELWRVVAPDFPFRGLFSKIPAKEIMSESRDLT